MPTALVILPTGTYRAADYLAAAERLGVEVVTASERVQALSHVMGQRFLQIPLDDPEQAAEVIVGHAGRLHLDAVVAVDDEGLLAAGIASERLGLRHSPVAALRRTRDKAAMRAAFALCGVPQPDFVVVDPPTAEAVAEAARELGPPVVVKPCSLSASRGVIRADDPLEAGRLAARISAILAEAGEPPGRPLLVERYVPGPEVAVEAVLTDGRLDVVTIFDKPDPLEGPYFEETLYLAPTRLSPELEAAVVEATRSAVRAIGLSNGPVHAEARVPGAAGVKPRAGRGPVAVLEVAGRTIGGRCSRALALEGGASLEELILARALGLPSPPTALASPAGVLMIPIPASGTLRAVRNLEEVRSIEHVTGVEITIPVGRQVRSLPEGDRYLGFVFAAAPERDAVESALRRALEVLDIEIEIDEATRPPAGGEVEAPPGTVGG